MALSHFLAENVWLRMSDFLTGNRVRKYFLFLQHSQEWSESQIQEYQLAKLKRLLAHASTNVPYYRDYFREHNLCLDDFQTLSDIEKLPIVSKSMIREIGQSQFVAENVPSGSYIVSRSSGSTGDPFSYRISKDAYAINLAAKLRTWYNNGYRLGDHYMKIGVGKGRVSLIKKIQDRINNCDLVPYFALNEQNVHQILDRIESTKPLYIRSYPSPLFALAQGRIKEFEKYHYSPRLIFTTGSTLPDEYRETIEKAFGCKVIDSYSCEGCPNVAQERDLSYEVSDEYGLLDVVNNEDEIIYDGIGRSVVTDFWNYAQPFIRYDTQDLVQVSSAKRKRGCRFQIEHIMGRECQSFVTKSGRLLTEHEFTTIKYSGAVESYQIVIKECGEIVIRIVPNNSFTESVLSEFQDYWSRQFETPVSVELVDEIPLMHNNKRMAIVKE